MTGVRRRDRHGRGVRGRLLPPAVTGPGGEAEVLLPAWRSRRDRFDDLVRDALEALLPRWEAELAAVELAVEDVPDTRPGAQPEQGLVADETAGGPVPLGRVLPATAEQPARLVLFRRPLEARGDDLPDLADLVHEVVVDLVAELLGKDPDEVDPPGYR